jgi:hypothetical protein
MITGHKYASEKRRAKTVGKGPSETEINGDVSLVWAPPIPYLQELSPPASRLAMML